MVINKGSERVAEVSARFTLDAMPGKQMAIDADLNTGAITDSEAKLRREKIQEEESDGLYILDIIRGGFSNDDPRIPRNISE